MWGNFLHQRLAQYQTLSLTRERQKIEKAQGNTLFIEGKRYTDFSSNDYLGLRNHPIIVEAFIEAAQKYGTGSGASAFVSGYSEEHAKTEDAFAKWLKVDKTLLFTSGYGANVGLIGALVGRSDLIYSDKLCHASLLDGITLSRAKHRRYPHGDLARLNALAASYPPDLIVTESIFSMEGTLCAVPSLIKITNQHNAGLLLDDAHGIGVLGETGAGIKEYYDLSQHSFSCLVLPLGKAFNALGAIVAGRAEIIESILQFCRTYRYTTALPPALCAVLQTTLKIVQEETWRRHHLNKNIGFFISYAREKGLNLIGIDETPIKPILIGENEKTLKLQQFLMAKGWYVPAIRPPTVPLKKARLRVSLNSLHTADEITQLVDAIHYGLSVW